MFQKKKAFLLVCCFHFVVFYLFGQAFEPGLLLSSDGDSLPYQILYPEPYDRGQSYPLVLFLHGAGERGSDNEAQLTHGASLFLDENQRELFPAIVVFPQCRTDGYWSSLEREGSTWSFPFRSDPNENLAQVMELLDKIELEESVDPDRIYVMGLSMGGFGTLELIARQPERFAAAVPICGGGNLALTKAYGPRVPVWLFHGALDDVVPPDLSRRLYRKLRSEGSAVSYTEYPYANHNSWDSAFAEPGLLPWMFEQRKQDRLNTDNLPVAPITTFTYARKDRVDLQLDFFRPDLQARKRRTTVLYVHGGGFAGGRRDEEQHIAFARSLVRRGYNVANISYRLTMKGKSFSCDQPSRNKLKTFLAAANDIRSATRFLFQRADSLGVETDRIILAGSSAGAEAILHAAFWDRQSAPGRLEPLPAGFRYAGLISMAGALVDTALIDAEKAIPAMLFHGTCDELVPYAAAPHHYCSRGEVGFLPLFGSFSIFEQLGRLGIASSLVTGCGGGHEWNSLPLKNKYVAEIDRFIKQAIEQKTYLRTHRSVRQAGNCPEKPGPDVGCRNSP